MIWKVGAGEPELLVKASQSMLVFFRAQRVYIRVECRVRCRV